MADQEKSVAELVDEGWRIRAEIRDKKAELEQVEAQLVKLGKGDHRGGSRAQCTVIIPSPTLKPTAEDVEACRKIAGSLFSKLFTKTISFSPVKGFREVAAALLTPAKSKKLIEQCEKPNNGFVKWAKDTGNE